MHTGTDSVALAMPSALPRSVRDYLRSPGKTLTKARGWLEAKWRLRACDHVGAWTRVTGKVFVDNHGSIDIGNRVQISSQFAHSVLATLPVAYSKLVIEPG